MSDPREEPVSWAVEAPRRMSVTLGKKADACPHDAGLYLRYKGGASNGPLLRGSLAHLAFERIMTALQLQGEASLFTPGFTQTVDHRGIPTGGMSEEGRMAAMAEVSQTTKEWVDSLADETGWPLSEAEIDEARVMAYHFAIGNSVDPETVVALEQMFVLELEGGAELIGKVDVASLGADGILQVDDYKSSFYVPPEDDVQKLVQSPWYAAMMLWGRPYARIKCEACNGTGIFKYTAMGPSTSMGQHLDCEGRGYLEVFGEPMGAQGGPLEHVQWVRCRQVYPRYINPTTGFMSSRGDDKLWGLADLRDKVGAAARAWRRVQRGVEQRVWPAKSGAHCSECTAEPECPLPRQLRRFGGKLETAGQASEAMEWAERQGALVTGTKAEVRAFVKARPALGGELPVGDRTYSMQVSHPTSLKKIGQKSDWEGLQAAVVAAAEEGEPFDVNDWLKSGTKTEFKPKREDKSNG